MGGYREVNEYRSAVINARKKYELKTEMTDSELGFLCGLIEEKRPKKIVEVDMAEKGTDLHAATVVGDTVGDPFKDTSSVAMNPIIKFTTLFGLLAMEIAIAPTFKENAKIAGVVFLILALFFVIRSFYAMRIPSKKDE